MVANGRQRQGETNVQGGTRKWIFKNTVFVLILAAIFFVSSGRLDWWMAWVYLAMMVANLGFAVFILLPKYPDLLAERSGMQEGAKDWDKVIVRFAAVFLPLLMWIVAGLDQRFGWSPPIPFTVQILALAVSVLGNALTFWAMASNAFFSAVVRIQTDRGHTVASGGPYRYVRHPGYVGLIGFDLSAPLALGSLWALIPGALAACLFVLRTALEDRTLQEELDGYRDYSGQVCYRLLPGVW